MSFRTRVLRSGGLLVLVLSFAAFALGDTIHLKDGSIIKGHIISFANGKFTVAIGQGSRLKQLTFMASEIESIQFDLPDQKPASTTAARDTDGGASILKTSTIAAAPVTVTTGNSGGMKNSLPSGSEKMKPISIDLKVLADNTANGWTNSGFVVKKGQKIRITGDGTVSLGKGHSSTPSGVGDLQDDQKLLKNVPTGALLAVIGDDNNDFIYIGAERTITATRDGPLFLGLNEGYLDDNSGAYNVKIEILPDDEN